MFPSPVVVRCLGLDWKGHEPLMLGLDCLLAWCWSLFSPVLAGFPLPRQSSDVRSTPWRRPASHWPHGRPSGGFRNAGRRVVDMAFWPVGFGDSCGHVVFLPFDSTPGSASSGLQARVAATGFLNTVLWDHGHAPSFLRFLWWCLHSICRIEHLGRT